jgi:hypothetical protein
VGYVEDAFEARTTHGKRRVSARRGRAGEKSDFFSILLDERRERRVNHRMPNHPFQPGGHQIFVQRGSIQTSLNVKSRLVADDPDDGGGILPIWK